jgi:hypothetical protein
MHEYYININKANFRNICLLFIPFLLLYPSFILNAQNNIKYIKQVPKAFITKYSLKKHEFNPLHVGDIWQYQIEETFPYYITTRIDKDSIINGKKYFKKINRIGDLNPQNRNLISWERNDSLVDNSYMLDYQDVNNDGNNMDELPIDSLSLPIHSHYISYKYSFPGSQYLAGKKEALIYDTSWAIVWNDTVLVKWIQYNQFLLGEMIIADKFGTISSDVEFTYTNLIGAVIDGKKYGILVSVDNEQIPIQNDFILCNNYPNPFNPSTIISYYLPKTCRIKIKIYDLFGREVALLINEEQTLGNHKIKFTPNNLASGIYFYSLISNSKIITKKMLFLK